MGTGSINNAIVLPEGTSSRPHSKLFCHHQPLSGQEKGLRQRLVDKGRARTQPRAAQLHTHPLYHLSWVKSASGAVWSGV